jgi:uncharacterized protein (TIGR03437 family)
MLSFDVSAAAGAPARLSAGAVPEGAVFDPSTGHFEWTPTQAQQGRHDVIFTATDQNNLSASASVAVSVGQGAPAIAAIGNGAAGSRYNACMPGSPASIFGDWLAADTAADASGSGNQLAGTQVLVNGEAVPVLYVSPSQVNFLCPSVAPGTTLEVAVENLAGRAGPVQLRMAEAAAQIVTLDGSGQGQAAITIADTSRVAMPRNYRYPGQPAEVGDDVSIPVIGIGATTNLATLVLKIGGISTPIRTVQPMAGEAGVMEIRASIPDGVAFGDSVPVTVETALPGGRVLSSNPATIAIELLQ